MTRITHLKRQPKNIYFWDYYILCHLNVAAAMAIQRMEYWDGTKDTAIIHATAHNDALQANNQTPTQDVSHWVYKAQDELRWELLGITGEKGIATLLNFLKEDVKYLVSRNNQHLPFDRKKQYEFQAAHVQEHLDYLSSIITYFQDHTCRLTPIYYAIELLTREHVYIENLSISHVIKRLEAMQTDTSLPKFLKMELAKDMNISILSAGSLTSFRSFAEWRAAKRPSTIAHMCAMDTADMREEHGKYAEWKTQACGSNSSNYKQSLQTNMTEQDRTTAVPSLSTSEQPEMATLTAILSLLKTMPQEQVHHVLEQLQHPKIIEEVTAHASASKQATTAIQDNTPAPDQETSDVEDGDAVSEEETLQKSIPTVSRIVVNRHEDATTMEHEPPQKPTPDAPRSGETVIALVEYLRGQCYTPNDRIHEVRAAQKLLNLQPAYCLADIEEAWVHGSDDYWRNTHSGDNVHVHDLVNRNSHGKYRIRAFLEHKRAQERQMSQPSSFAQRDMPTVPPTQPHPLQLDAKQSSLSEEQAQSIIEHIARDAAAHGYGGLHGDMQKEGSGWMVRVSWSAPLAWKGDLGVEIHSVTQWQREFLEWQEVLQIREARNTRKEAQK